ncbi:uncharacterized protein LOC104885354 isoform X1 [Beta vulgaris subsp. vulgaris]|uniref:uncharacterized protein LOC104885354 isoform X1 n=1 Tax=Beta vulgaris subsp. vulgaris TaxID=3555 RepID=UPI002036A842|nr:uncharacterized protein LOC104885354 isoform X1 [Beta vulgaris subsp. vulgaris]
MASSAVKVKPINRNQATPSSSKPILKKKIEIINKHPSASDTKNKSIPVKSAKSEEKGKKAAPATPVKKATKREKKVYSLAGQKYDPPEEREPLRIFYESLSKQIPTSEMAEFWLMEHGLLSSEKAKKAHERKQRKQKQQKMGTPIKSPPSYSKPESSNRQKLVSKNGDLKVKKRFVEDSDDEVIGIPKRRKS